MSFTDLIINFGYIGVALTIFAESGLFVGFFLPGDSLLVTVGLLASQGIFDIWLLVPLLAACAILGDSVGYWTGHKYGKRLFQKEESLFFHKKNLERAQRFFEKHGGKTIVLARFVPVVRTFAPIVAGIGSMKYASFLFYNIFGGLLWAAGLTLVGFFLGALVPNVDLYFLPIIVLIVVVSILPAAIHVLRDPEHRAEIREMFGKIRK
jgi:membrane-associated protein